MTYNNNNDNNNNNNEEMCSEVLGYEIMTAYWITRMIRHYR